MCDDMFVSQHKNFSYKSNALFTTPMVHVKVPTRIKLLVLLTISMIIYFISFRLGLCCKRNV